MVASLNMNCINEKRTRILSSKWLWLILSNYSTHTSYFCRKEYQASTGWKIFGCLVNQLLINRHEISSCEKNSEPESFSFTLKKHQEAVFPAGFLQMRQEKRWDLQGWGNKRQWVKGRSFTMNCPPIRGLFLWFCCCWIAGNQIIQNFVLPQCYFVVLCFL